MEAIFDWSIAHEWRDETNPAELKKVKLLLPKISKKQRQVRHHPAMRYDKVPAFMARLVEDNSTVSRALQFIILTALRTNEALQAEWKEIDWDNRVWTIPKERMKSGEAHRVPLSDAAMEILSVHYMRRVCNFIFAGKDNKPITNIAVRHALHRTWNGDGEVTIHGFRSSFRDWSSDVAHARYEVAEAALAHTGDPVVRAYLRTEHLDARRELMQSWASWCQKIEDAPRESRTMPEQHQEASPSQ
jgi:integrase